MVDMCRDDIDIDTYTTSKLPAASAQTSEVMLSTHSDIFFCAYRNVDQARRTRQEPWPVCMCVCIYVCVCVYIYIYIYI